MKKLILAASLMVGTAFASFAAVQHNVNDGYPIEVSFTFTSDGSYGILFGLDPMNIAASPPQAFGYYFIDNPTEWFSGIFTGNNSDYYSNNVSNFGTSFVDIETGYLGEFKAGDTIGLWVQDRWGMIWTSTDIEEGYFNGVYRMHGAFTVGAQSYSEFAEMAPPVGEPLPGVIAALAIGGCAFLGKKLRKSIKK